MNPYGMEPVQILIPASADELTLNHLQILARNERINTTGIMQSNLYPPDFTLDQIASLRCLVQATTVSGLVHPSHWGGFPEGRPRRELPHASKAIVIDQSGLQWQGDLRNTGGLFFYPADPASTALPNYEQWQNEMYQARYGVERPRLAPEDSIDIQWNGVPGKLNSSTLKQAFSIDFSQALESAVNQGNVSLRPGDKINFKFLKSGMGFFAEGLQQDSGLSLMYDPSCEKQTQLELLRLNGIADALTHIFKLPVDERQAALGNVKRIELPFSASEWHVSKNEVQVALMR